MSVIIQICFKISLANDLLHHLVETQIECYVRFFFIFIYIKQVTISYYGTFSGKNKKKTQACKTSLSIILITYSKTTNQTNATFGF